MKCQCVVASSAPCAGYMACNLGMCPDWESNQRYFGSQAHAQSTELHQPGLYISFESCYFIYSSALLIAGIKVIS